MAVGMTKSEIWKKVKTDPDFMINFIIDNNPAAVDSKIQAQGVMLPANPSNAQIRSEIDAFINQINEGVNNTDLIANDLLAVEYINTNPNYTGGMESNPEFMEAAENDRASNPNNKIQGSIWVAVIAGAVTAVGGVINGIQNKKIAEIEQEKLREKLAYQAERFESGKVFGVPMVVVLSMIGFFAFVSYLAYKKKS